MAKGESERPEGCKYWTHKDVEIWISIHVDLNEANQETPEAAALWWKACMDAESLRDLNGREMAQFCLDGMEPTSLNDITEEIQARHEDAEETVAEIDEMWENELHDFFHTLKGEQG